MDQILQLLQAVEHRTPSQIRESRSAQFLPNDDLVSVILIHIDNGTRMPR